VEECTILSEVKKEVNVEFDFLDNLAGSLAGVYRGWIAGAEWCCFDRAD